MSQNTSQYKHLPLFIILCTLAMGFGGLFMPGPWYESLQKAPWTPPNIAFPVVWSFLYVFIAVSGWQIFSHHSSRLKWLWSIQLAVNTAWSWVFFGQHWVLIGLIDLIILDALVLTMIIKCFKSQLKAAAILMIPYIIWLCIATSLNAFILVNN